MEDTVVVDPGLIAACLVSNPPLVSYVWLRTSEDLSVDPDAALATQPVTINGTFARRGQDQLRDRRTRVVLVVPSRKVVVIVVSNDPGLVRQIIDSAAVVA
jgi:hypothetical protein